MKNAKIWDKIDNGCTVYWKCLIVGTAIVFAHWFLNRKD